MLYIDHISSTTLFNLRPPARVSTFRRGGGLVERSPFSLVSEANQPPSHRRVQTKHPMWTFSVSVCPNFIPTSEAHSGDRHDDVIELDIDHVIEPRISFTISLESRLMSGDIGGGRRGTRRPTDRHEHV